MLEKFKTPFTLSEIKLDSYLKDMMVCQRVDRLSIQPVSKTFNYICHKETIDILVCYGRKEFLSFIKTKFEQSVHPIEIKANVAFELDLKRIYIDTAFKHVRELYTDIHQDLVAVQFFSTTFI